MTSRLDRGAGALRPEVYNKRDSGVRHACIVDCDIYMLFFVTFLTCNKAESLVQIAYVVFCDVLFLECVVQRSQRAEN